MFKPVDPHPNFPELEEEVLKFWEDNKIFEKSVEMKPPHPPLTPPIEGGEEDEDSPSGSLPLVGRAREGEQGGVFVFYEGPPTANAAPGIHHVEARSFKDIIPRFQTMRGKYVRRKAGWDTHGLPVELQIEKKLGISGKKQIESLKDTPRESIAYFNKLCRESVWEFKGEWEKLTKRMGFWVDMEHPYITYENGYIEKVWGVIKQIWDKGLVYQGHKVVPYCPRCGTALSSHEVAQGYKTVTDVSVTVKFPISNFQFPNTYLLAWTTTPWTLPGNVALAVGEDIDYAMVRVGEEYYILAKDRLPSVIPAKAGIQETGSPGSPTSRCPEDDKPFEVVAEFKGKELVGLEYEPLFNISPIKSDRSYKVYAADFVTTEDGTGVVHTAVMYGEDDYRLGEEVGLPKHHTVDEEGRFTADLSEYGLAGLSAKDRNLTLTLSDIGEGSRAQARAGGVAESAENKIIKYLEENNLLFKTESYTHEYPHCWRCSTPLLYYARNSWFIKMSQLRGQLQKNNQDINWVPEYIKEGRFGQWLSEAKDWAISRERYWGTPLPIWQCQDCGEYRVVGSVEELQEKATRITNQESRVTDKKSRDTILDLHRPYVDDIILKCQKCGGQARRIPEVADVWFDSGSMPFAQDYNSNLTPAAVTAAPSPSIGEGNNDAVALFPADFISEAIDQTRGWFYTLLAIATLLDKGTPYKNVICLGHLLDAKGQKMSKSKGNVVNPWDVGNKYGFDAIRWYFYTVNQPGDTKLFDEKDLAGIQRRVQLILWNVYNYFVTYANEAGWEPERITNQESRITDKKTHDTSFVLRDSILDQWILALTQQLINEVTESLEKYDIFHAVRNIELYINELSTWYLRRSRGRKDHEFFATLYHCLVMLTKLLAPGMPFLAEAIYGNLKVSATKGDVAEGFSPPSVHLSPWPEIRKLTNDEELLLKQMKDMRMLVEEVHALRAKAGIKLRQPLGKLVIMPINTTVNGQATGSSPIYRLLADEVNVKEIVLGDKLELDTTITEDLRIEGAARELERQIQIFRKESGFKIGEIVDLKYRADSDIIKKAIGKVDRNKIYVKNITESEVGGGKELDIDGEKIQFIISNS